MKSYSQAGQDLFVLNIHKYKKNGTYLELGSQDPINNSNTYINTNTYTNIYKEKIQCQVH